MGINRTVQNAYFNNMMDKGKEMSSEDFKRWLMRFDMDRDGKLSLDELERAISLTGTWFSKMKARYAIRNFGKRESGYIVEDEIFDMVGFARKHLGLNIILEGGDEARG